MFGITLARRINKDSRYAIVMSQKRVIRGQETSQIQDESIESAKRKMKGAKVITMLIDRLSVFRSHNTDNRNGASPTPNGYKQARLGGRGI